MRKKGDFSHSLQSAEKGRFSHTPFAENGLIYIFSSSIFFASGSVCSRPGKMPRPYTQTQSHFAILHKWE